MGEVSGWNGGIVKNCYNAMKGNIDGPTNPVGTVGGFVGSARNMPGGPNSSNVIIENCYNAMDGDIYSGGGNYDPGSFVGKTTSANFANNYYLYSVEVDGQRGGGGGDDSGIVHIIASEEWSDTALVNSFNILVNGDQVWDTTTSPFMLEKFKSPPWDGYDNYNSKPIFLQPNVPPKFKCKIS